jgi:hypothetical protein
MTLFVNLKRLQTKKRKTRIYLIVTTMIMGFLNPMDPLVSNRKKITLSMMILNQSLTITIIVIVIVTVTVTITIIEIVIVTVTITIIVKVIVTIAITMAITIAVTVITIATMMTEAVLIYNYRTDLGRVNSIRS